MSTPKMYPSDNPLQLSLSTVYTEGPRTFTFTVEVDGCKPWVVSLSSQHVHALNFSSDEENEELVRVCKVCHPFVGWVELQWRASVEVEFSTTKHALRWRQYLDAVHLHPDDEDCLKVVYFLKLDLLAIASKDEMYVIPNAKYHLKELKQRLFPLLRYVHPLNGHMVIHLPDEFPVNIWVKHK